MRYENLNEKMLDMKDEIFASIKESIAIESVKGEPEADAPYGRGPKEALDHALALGEKLGFRTGNLDNKVGWIEYGEGEEMAAVLGHLDVVPIGEGWNYPPLACEVHDGVMYGRGILDDKGPVIGAIYALKAIRDLGLPIDRRLRVIFGTDEENGSSCVQHYIEAGGEKPTIGFTPDAEYPVIFCEKGQSFWEVTKKIENPSKVKILSIDGGTAKNVVTPKCTLVAEGEIDVKEAEGITVTKADGKTVVVAEGKGAHGSTPHLGINAAKKLFEAVKDSGIDGDVGQMMAFILEKIGAETNGKSLGICYNDEETGETTVNLGVVKVTEEEIFFTLDIRYPKSGNREELIANVKKHAEEYGLNANVEAEGKLLYVPKDSELVQKLTGVYRAQTGADDEPIAIGGGTYAKAFDNMVAFGPIFPGDPDVIHQPNECADVDKLMKSFQIVAAAMYEIAQK
ncbi:dipeptidase PepV [Sellimonas caecigallum]|uniref:Dipeptidase PepV n=1 Tax=Sellimonas caecigallum TaxID=2592333 RepID=A0ABS7L778_9FIRM|nr:dipeptidase PepV [Sellimonas caecigallum]MBY0758812.1 dipeptidase PepV [Sellimonas caecigallum]OUP66875.1 dipeptidase PepV [Drancourtella sp. An177]